MKIEASESAKCRYGGNATRAFPDAEVLWESAENDYQGTVALVFRMPDGHLGFYEWSYGSCSGCDDWEARDLPDNKIEAEMVARTAFFHDATALLAWLGMAGVSGAYSRPSPLEIEPLLAPR